MAVENRKLMTTTGVREPRQAAVRVAGRRRVQSTKKTKGPKKSKGPKKAKSFKGGSGLCSIQVTTTCDDLTTNTNDIPCEGNITTDAIRYRHRTRNLDNSSTLNITFFQAEAYFDGVLIDRETRDSFLLGPGQTIVMLYAPPPTPPISHFHW